jgi:hypothetical protein
MRLRRGSTPETAGLSSHGLALPVLFGGTHHNEAGARPRGSDPVARRLVAVRRPENLALAVIVLAGVALRLYFSIRLRPSLIGFPDSGVYILAAHGQPFENSLREAGYSLFLRFMHSLWPHLVLVIWVQHLLGLFSGLLLYGTVRRAGLPRALGLIPAAIVILSGDEIFIEHAPLTESLFVFLVVLGLYALVRAWRGNWWWAAPAGLSLGAAVDIRSLGLVLAAMLVVVAALIYVGTWRGRLLRVALTVLGVAVPIAAYLIAHQAATGQAVLTTAGNFNLYGRVAPFADCSRFTPPAGTRDLCITVPVNRRPGPSAWLFSGASPAVRAYGEPDGPDHGILLRSDHQNSPPWIGRSSARGEVA